MRQYEMFELEFQGKEPEGSWTDVPFGAVFGWENEAEEAFSYKRVKGFYAGNGIYKVRFCPEKTYELNNPNIPLDIPSSNATSLEKVPSF